MKKIILIFAFLCFAFYALQAQNITTISETDDNIVLSNGLAELVFSRGKIYSLKSLKLGSKYTLADNGMNTMPWVITYKGVKGENPTLTPDIEPYEGYKIIKLNNGIAVEFTWQSILIYDATHPIKMTVTLPNNSELAYWDIEAYAPKGWVVTKIDFPRININRPDGAKLITSAGWGAEYLMKTKTYDSRYPSVTGAMQLLLMHNANGAFYYATEDKNACGKYFKAISSDKRVMFFTETITSEGWTNAETGCFKLPWSTVIGYTPDGWREAATKWYRAFTYTTEWGNKTLQQRNIPQWVYNADAWIRVKDVNEKVMEGIRKSLAYFGKGLLYHCYYWHNYPYDTHYPEYFPPKQGFDKMIKEIQNGGCYATPYINGRLWDPAAKSYDELGGAQASCRKADGTLYTEVYGSKVLNTVTCPSSKIWQEIQTTLVDRLQNELNVNGVYIDQIAAAPSEPCWAKNHGHALGGGDFWYKSYRSLMTDLRKNHLKNGNIFTSEENSECYIDLFDILLTVNTPHGDCKIVPLFPIVYSDRVITSAYTYTPITDASKGDFRYENMQCLLYGSQLGWIEVVLLMRDDSKTEAQFLKNLMLFRRQQHDVFYGGRFIKEIAVLGDNPTKNVPGFGVEPVVKAAEWTNINGKKVIFAVNMDEHKHSVKIDEYGKTIDIEGLSAVRINF